MAIERVTLPDYGFLKGHEFSAGLYQTDAALSWTGAQYSGIKVT